jgi:cellulose synthase/poly-beta-1,6-N-acetylglucosamine synthase-like glycosyltransferase
MTTVSIPLPPDGVGEFRAIKRDVPKLLVRFLLLFTSFYGLFLTLSVPWSLRAVIFDEIRYTAMGPFAYVWGGMLLIFGTAVMVRWCAVQALAFWEYDKRILNGAAVNHDQTPFVSIMVPAFNESDTIIPAIHSLVNLDYPSYEVTIIDDGSTDDTYAKALLLAGDYGRCTVRVLTKPNGGKWSALNLAYNESKADYLLCVDADSRLSSDALRRLVARLSEPGVAGVAGQVTVRNRDRLLNRIQAAEYLLGNGGMRMALSHLGLVTVVPGPIGLYRRSVLEEIKQLPCNQGEAAGHGVSAGRMSGPLSGETFAEDFQLSLSCLALGHKVVYEPRAIAYTKCPHTVEGLLNQRYRWMRGTWQVLRVYARDLRPRNRALPSAQLPTLHHIMMLLYTVDVYVVPILNFFFWFALAGCAAMGLNLSGIAAWIGAVSLLNVTTALLYILLQDDDISILAVVPLLDIYQALLVNSAWFIGGIDELRQSRMSWS